MPVELTLKKVPESVKELITREADLHRRSINQEAIVLLEEALAARARRGRSTRTDIEGLLSQYRALPDVTDERGVPDFDDVGLPR